MSILAAKDTLAYQMKGRPLTLNRDMRNVQTPVMVERLQEYMKTAKADVSPEAQAITFYTMNHAAALVAGQVKHPHQPLTPDQLYILDAYNTFGSAAAVRLFYYLVLICARESRHLHNKESMADEIISKFGQEAYKFLKDIPDHPHQSVKRFRDNPPTCTIGQYVEMLSYVFYKGHWSGGYGGKKWAIVCDCLVRFVRGEYSAEMMLDTGYTLAHNGGPIFNKGMLFGTYSHDIFKILDVQRSGQMPQLVAEGVCGGSITYETKQFHARARKLFPEEFSGHVDWYKVEALGAVKNYHKEQAEQLQIHGPSKWQGVPKKAHKHGHSVDMSDAEPTITNMFYGIKDDEENFTIMPGLVVPKVKIDRPAEVA